MNKEKPKSLIEKAFRKPKAALHNGDILIPAEPLNMEKVLLKATGTHAGGVPKGLWFCPSCGEWRGKCFDTLCRRKPAHRPRGEQRGCLKSCRWSGLSALIFFVALFQGRSPGKN